MEAEFFQLAQEAATALQAANQPNWAEIAAVIVSGVVGLGQLILIGVGLAMMKRSGDRRDRQLDLMEAGQREQSERLGTALERQGEVLAELLRRTA